MKLERGLDDMDLKEQGKAFACMFYFDILRIHRSI